MATPTPPPASAAPSTRQKDFYRKIMNVDMPDTWDRKQAANAIAAEIMKRNGTLPAGAPNTPPPAAQGPKPNKKQKPKPVVQKMITTITWPVNPLPPIPPESMPFAHMVPSDRDLEIVEFVPRQPYWDHLADAHAECVSVQLVGPSGCGKSIMSKTLAYARQLPLLSISCDGKLNPRVLFGQLNIKAGTSGFTEGVFTQLSQVPSVIVLEEKNGLDSSVQMTFNRAFNNREFFIPEADNGKGKMYRLHPDCYLMGDCNPPGAKYQGAQKENVASIDRLLVMNIPQLEETEIKAILDKGTPSPYTDNLTKFYLQANEEIEKIGFRCAVTLRGLKRAKLLLGKGYSQKDAIEMSMLNAVRLTGGDEAADTIESLAKGIFNFTSK